MNAQKTMIARRMPVDGIVSAVERNSDGTATIYLVPRPLRDGSNSSIGHSHLFVLNPPPFFESIVGVAIWGGKERIMVNTSEIAKRVNADSIVLTGKRK